MSRPIEGWDRRLKVMDGGEQIGQDVVLDMLDLTVDNERRLPKYILLRQVRWDDGHLGSEFHIELAQLGNVLPMVSMTNVAATVASNDARSRYILVELGWYERDSEPFLHDVMIFDDEGCYTSTHQRDKVRRLAERAAASA